MKTTLLLCFLTLFAAATQAQETGKRSKKAKKEQASGEYDPKLAEKVGADEYGMKRYVMAFLKAGPNRSQDSTARAQLMRAHLDNITRMAEEKKLVVAGPFLDNGDIRGIYIFNVETIEEAEALTNTDPAVQAGMLVMELHPWYGSAALVEAGERHKLVAKKKI